MSLVFNALLANKYSSVLLLLLLSKSLLAATPLGSECATLDLTAINEKNQPVIYELLSNNNSAIDENAYIDNKKGDVLLFQGQHSLKLREWREENYLNYTRAKDQNHRQEFINKTINHYVLITVESDFVYQLVSTNYNGKKTLTIEKNAQICSTENKSPLLAKSVPILADALRSVILPRNLESELYNLMDQLAVKESLLMRPPQPIKNIVPLKLMGSFGLTLNKGNELSYKELKVLTVYPFSVANTLKLASGDVIVNLGNKVDLMALGTPNNKLQHYINSLNIGDKIEITVMRDNEKYVLVGNYQPTVLPESYYRIMPYTNIKKPIADGCASISRYSTGIKGYKIMSHNGVSLKEIYGTSSPRSMKLSPGVHRFEAVFSPRRISAMNLNGGSYSRSDDISPRVSRGSKTGDVGIKEMMRARTGSVNGWFKNSKDNRYVRGNYVLDAMTGKPLLSITLNVERGNKYKLKVEQEYTHPNVSSYDVTSLATPADENCTEDALESIFPSVLNEQPLVESNPLNRSLQFKFDQLLLEVKTYYQENGINKGVVDIYREKKSNNNFGILGKMVDFETGYALLIKQITDNSMASRAGLKVGDKIITFNKKSFDNKEPKEFLLELGELKHGQEYELMITRERRKENISSTFVSNVLPAFHLSVDMTSVGKAKHALNGITHLH